MRRLSESRLNLRRKPRRGTGSLRVQHPRPLSSPGCSCPSPPEATPISCGDDLSHSLHEGLTRGLSPIRDSKRAQLGVGMWCKPTQSDGSFWDLGQESRTTQAVPCGGSGWSDAAGHVAISASWASQTPTPSPVHSQIRFFNPHHTSHQFIVAQVNYTLWFTEQEPHRL